MAEFGILPLGSQVVHERLPHVKSLLLYGAPKTGKTMLAHVSRGQGIADCPASTGIRSCKVRIRATVPPVPPVPTTNQSANLWRVTSNSQ